MDAIEQTLSSAQVLPRNRFVEFDIEDDYSESSPTGMPNNETDDEL
jgi:hypothetical protein